MGIWDNRLMPNEEAEMIETARRSLVAHAERMKLRDQFAAAALTGLLSSMQKNVYAEEAASHAYEIADAMLASREAK